MSSPKKNNSPVDAVISPVYKIKQPGNVLYIANKVKLLKLKKVDAGNNEALINCTDDLLWSVSSNFKLIAANEAFTRSLRSLTGLTFKPGGNLLIKGVFKEELLTFWEGCYKKALLGESFKKEIYTPAFNDWKASWTDTSFSPIYKNKKVVGIACYCRNITEKKTAEEKIKESELRYRSLIEQATEAICIADTSLKIIDINSSGCQMLGYSKEEFLQLSITDLLLFDDLKTNPFKIDELKSGKVISNERRFRRKDGTIAEVEINAKILEDGRFVIFAHDITERKQSGKVLQAAYNEKNTILESIADAFFAVDKNWIVTYWNKQAEKMLHTPKNEIVGHNLWEVFSNSIDSESYKKYHEAVETNQAINFEDYYLILDKWYDISAYPSGTGLSVYFRDVTERKKSEDKIKESELRYRILNEQATDAICITDSSMKFIHINPYGYEILGYTKEEALQLTLSDILFEEDLTNNPLKNKELKLGKTIRNERRIKRKDGTPVVMEVSTKLLEDGRMIMFGHDVSESKKVAQLIIESEAKYRTLFEQNMAGVYQSTTGGVILNCNNAFAKMLKYDSPAELCKINASELYFSVAERNAFTDTVFIQKKINNYEAVLKCKDGSQLYIIENISLRKDDITGEEFFSGIMIDITEKKQAELGLKESNERYNLISKATNDMVWDWDLITGKVYRNKEGWKKIFRTGEIEIENETIDNWDDRIHPYDRDKVKLVNEEIQKSEKDFFEVECRVLRDDGTYAYIHDRANIIRNEQGKAIRLLGATQDITQRKEAEEQVTKSELRFRSLVQNSSDLICILDEKTNYLYSSPAVKKILGYEPEYMIGKTALSFIHPDDIGVLYAYIEKIKSGGYVEITPFRFKNAQGEWRWLESRITDQQHNPEIKGFVVNSRDVTERKIAEDEIKKLSVIASETSNSVIITDAEGKIVWVNEAFTKITEFESEEVVGKKPGDFLQGEDTNLAVVRFMRNKIKKVSSFKCDIINYSKSGKKYWIRIQCQPQFDEAGKLKYFFAIETDITKEKEAEEILKASEERYRHLFNNNPASIFIWDLDNFKILEINNTAIELYGYCRDQFLTKTALDLSLTEDYDKIKRFTAMARQKFDFKSEITCRHINNLGEEMFMHIGSHRIQFKGRPAILALATNITDKVILEKILEEERLVKQKEITAAVISAQEQERQELGSELHDNINQILAGSLLYLGLTKKALKNENPYIEETEVLINSAISEIRKLSHSLIPPSLNESEFLEALENMIQVTQKASGIMISLQAFGFDESTIADKLKLNIYRIVQEQLNNILKHAAAQKVIVRLVRDNEKTLLSIKDDGVGFDTSKKANGVGLMNIKTRACLFNGSVTIISSEGRGCELRVLFS